MPRFYIEQESNGRDRFVWTYASLANVIRFGLSREWVKPGQYGIYQVSEDGTSMRFLSHAYRRN